MKTLRLTFGQPGATVPVTFYQPATITDFDQPPRRPLVILLPGGGYRFYSDRENEIVALQYLAAGYAVAVVAYRLLDQAPVYPTALSQLATVVRTFHQQAATYAVDAKHILLVGFSAGGHLAALYADLWPRIVQEEALPSQDYTVWAVTLAYPVIGLRLGWPTDQAVRRAIAGQWTLTEADQLVTAQNPPTFMWTTATDELVPALNAQCYEKALRRVGVPVHFHLYPRGPHALSLARRTTALAAGASRDRVFGQKYVRPDVAHWFTEQLRWLARLW